MESVLRSSAVFILSVVLCGCGERARFAERDGFGPNPLLPPPAETLLPTTSVASARGWTEGRAPVPAAGAAVTAFATGLDHPRSLYVLPNGDVLVAETSAPPRPEDASGIRGWAMRLIMKKAGSAVPSADRITRLRDGDGDGIAEERSTFLGGLHSPFGMALVGHSFYVANTDAVIRFPYVDGAARIDGKGEVVARLPAGPLNHHWVKSLIASADGRKLYVGVGSNSNAAENGIEREQDRALVLEIDPQSGRRRVFASGLRNPCGMAWEPYSGKLWTVVNERDELGSDLVPDYMTALTDGGFYGWPYSYYGSVVDLRVEPQRPDLVARAIKPDYALGAHTASLGLAYGGDVSLPAELRHGMFVSQHGSWNRKPPSGYRVLFVPFAGGRPSGEPRDVLTGFLDEHGDALGRPVGLAIDRRGGLLVADDAGNTVWRVAAASGAGRPSARTASAARERDVERPSSAGGVRN